MSPRRAGRLPTSSGARALRAAALTALLGLAAAALALPATAGDPVEEAVARFRETLGRKDDAAYERQREAAQELSDIGGEAACRALRGLVEDERARGRSLDRRRAVILLSSLVCAGGVREAQYAIEVAQAERDAFLMTSLARVLACARDPASLAWLRTEGLRRTVPPVRAQVARALGAAGDKAAVAPLLATLREDDPEVRAEVLEALGLLAEPSTLPHVTPLLASPDARLREAAARALGAMGSVRAVPALLAALEDPERLVVESAATALGVLGDPSAVPALVDRLSAERPRDLRLAEAVQAALARLTGVDLGDDADLWRAWWAANGERARSPAKPPDTPVTAAGARYYGFPVRTSRVVFVIDVSRSMGWNGRLDRAKKELSDALAHLPASTRFEIVAYSDRADGWAGKLVPATPENVRRALRHVERLEPLNATNVCDALRAAFRIEDADTVFFLSDGSPTVGSLVDPDEILAEVRAANRWRRVRVHAVALLVGEPPGLYAAAEDPAAAASFMRRLAAENGGALREVR